MGTKRTISCRVLLVVILMQMKSFRCNTIEVSSYSKVATNGLDAATDIPRVHRAREGVTNADIIFPKVFNKSEALTNAGRAVDSRPFRFPLNNIQSLASNHRGNSAPQIVYSRPISSQKLAMDRFTPGEAYSFQHKKRNPSAKKESDREDDNNVGVIRAKPLPANNYVPPPTPNNYIPPRDLYSFPPNVDSIYPPPDDSFKQPVYRGPFNPEAFPPLPANDDNAGFNNNNDDDMINSKPDDANASQNDNGNSQNDDTNPNDDPSMIPMGYKDSPQRPLSRPPFPPPPPPLASDIDENHHHDHPPFINFGSPPPSDLPFPFDPNVLKQNGNINPYSDIIFDHDPHHDHHDHHDHDFFDYHQHLQHLPPPPPPPPPPPAAPPPPPPPPPPQEEEEPEEPEEQPRVKKYSYFYLSRSLWYIPLYFTVYFTFYVTWLILQSIGRHKVDLPNHITSRRSIRDLSHKETVHKVNLLTEFVLSQIDDFKDKYL